MSALSQLGLVYGTQQRGRDFYSLYLEPAFVSTGTYVSAASKRCPRFAALLGRAAAAAHCC